MSKEIRNEEVLEVLADFANALEAAVVNMRHKIGVVVGVKAPSMVKEETFNILKFETQTGSRIGEFEVASEKVNLPEKWSQAYNILDKNNATIGSRYHGETYQYSYWLYKDRIYRQKRT